MSLYTITFQIKQEINPLVDIGNATSGRRRNRSRFCAILCLPPASEWKSERARRQGGAGRRKDRRLDVTDRIIIEACTLDHRTLGQIASRPVDSPHLRLPRLRGICSERTVRRLLSAKPHQLRRYVRFSHRLPPTAEGGEAQ